MGFVGGHLPEIIIVLVVILIIWGPGKLPDVGAAMGKERAAHFRNSSFHLVPAGHWLQSDMPKQVAELMLA